MKDWHVWIILVVVIVGLNGVLAWARYVEHKDYQRRQQICGPYQVLSHFYIGKQERVVCGDYSIRPPLQIEVNK